MFDHPQVTAEGLVATFEHPVVGQYRGVNHPIHFGRTPAPESFAAPTLNQHESLLMGPSTHVEPSTHVGPSTPVEPSTHVGPSTPVGADSSANNK
jgi:hypothetical protein